MILKDNETKWVICVESTYNEDWNHSFYIFSYHLCFYQCADWTRQGWLYGWCWTYRRMCAVDEHNLWKCNIYYGSTSICWWLPHVDYILECTLLQSDSFVRESFIETLRTLCHTGWMHKSVPYNQQRTRDPNWLESIQPKSCLIWNEEQR